MGYEYWQANVCDEVTAEIEPFVDYYRRSGGGLTVTGGEPTLQATFVEALFREVKRRYGLHTVLDTSGFCDPEHTAGLLESTDLVLLDLKQMDTSKHTWLTGHPNERILRFAKRLSELHKPMWIRHVLVPGISDGYADLLSLGEFAGGLRSVEKLELLPYHRMGVYKWQQLGKTYPLDSILAPSQCEMERAYSIVDLGRKVVLR